MSHRERTITSQDNLQLYFRDYGDAAWTTTPILCLTGLTRNSKDFHDLALRLSESGRRVICPDYRGRGRSQYDRNWRNYRPQTYVHDVRNLLAATGAHRVIVIGTSLGGIIAMALGAAQPSALAAVVLNDVGPEIHIPGLAAIIDYIRVDRPQPDLETAIATAHKMLPNLSFRDPEVWRKLAENTYRRGADGLLHFDWDVNIVMPMLQPDGPAPDLWPFFRALRRVPTLALRGARSDILTQACFERMAEAKPDLVRALIPETGHAPSLQEPEAQAALDGFISHH